MTKTLYEMADFFINFDIEKKSGKNLQGKNRLTQNGGTDRVKPPHFHVYMGGQSRAVSQRRLIHLK